jgi:hypothetical protein
MLSDYPNPDDLPIVIAPPQKAAPRRLRPGTVNCNARPLEPVVPREASERAHHSVANPPVSSAPAAPAAPPFPLPEPLGRPKVRLTFALANHADVLLDFEHFQTIADAKRVLAARYSAPEADVVLLYQGKALADRLVLSRLRLLHDTKLRVFVKSMPTFSFATADSVAKAHEPRRYRLVDSRDRRRVLTVDADLNESVADIQQKIAELLAVGNPRRIALVHNGRVLDEIAILADVDLGGQPLEFTVNPEVVARFREMQANEEEGTRPDKMDVAKELLEMVTSGEIAAVQAAKPKELKLPEAVALYVQSNRCLDALKVKPGR